MIPNKEPKKKWIKPTLLVIIKQQPNSLTIFLQCKHYYSGGGAGVTVGTFFGDCAYKRAGGSDCFTMCQYNSLS